jgi:glutamate-1-semialdehyde 2,1-aminomutase
LTAGAALSSTTLESLQSSLSDLRFTTRYRVPFQYSKHIAARLKPGAMADRSQGVLVRDLDGGESFDLTGSYGVNLFGYDFYKDCIRAGMARVEDLGPVLGAYHPVVADNVRRLKAISGLDEVSFHMSGTEAVMQAVRLARFHTGRTHLVRFCGSYHGWWDDVQPGVGTPVAVSHTYTLREMDSRSLQVLESRTDIACVLVNPLQVLHPNSGAPADGTLVGSRPPKAHDRLGYATWLASLRDVCTRRNIVLIFDEVFVGFRIAPGGAQEYFGVRAVWQDVGRRVADRCAVRVGALHAAVP